MAPRRAPASASSVQAGRRARLGRDEIERAALAVVDADGVAALTMRRLGTELGVEAMALYYHVSNKAALLDRVAARVAAEIRFDPEPGEGWQTSLERFGTSLRAALLAHPRALPLLATRPLDPETGVRLVAPLLPVLVAAGFDEEGGILAVQCVAVYTIGHALAEAGADPGAGGDADDDTNDGGAPAGEATVPQGDADYYDRWYELGLRALVRGLDPVDL